MHNAHVSTVTVDGVTGAKLSAELAGGGGWGDPFERAPEKVLQDVMDEKVSRQSAIKDYGVAITEGGALDMEQTARLRLARKAAE